MELAPQSFYNNFRTNENTARDSARITDFDPLGLLSESRRVTGTSLNGAILNDAAASMDFLNGFSLEENSISPTNPNNLEFHSAVALTDIVPALGNYSARWAEEDEENEEDDLERDPNDAPRSGPTTRIIDAPKNGEYGPDGHIVSGTDTYEDGSTRFVRYYPPVEIDGVLQSNPQEQTIVHPDGSSEYRHYTPDGETDLIQTSRADGSVSTTTFGQNETTTESHDAGGWVHTTRSTPQGRIIEHITEQPNGDRRVATFSPDGSYLTQNYSRTGQLVGSYRLPPELSGHFGQFLNDGGIRIDMNSPTGTPARSITIDGTGRVLSESSMYPDGQIRETVTYNHTTETRSVVRFDTRGVQTQPIVGQRYRPPTYAVRDVD